VIHRLKYGEKIQLAGPLGRLLLTTFFRHWKLGEIDMVVPVPLHRHRFKGRGFNQSHLVVRGWAELLAKATDGVATIRISYRSLVRHRRTRPQTGLGRKERIENLRHAFSLTGAVNLTDQRVLLVDDVLTTGATLEECTKVLLDGGAAHVDVLTLARAE
jgi:ComF family protein